MAHIWDERKKGLEEEYFHRKEQQAMEKLPQRLAAQAPAERDASPRCPKCGEALEEVSVQEVLVDRCPNCKGIWLDPGELERLTAKEGSKSWLSQFWRIKDRSEEV
jgi:phage FluMu protein Com